MPGGVEGSSKKEKELMDTDNSVVIGEDGSGRGHGGVNRDGKNK